MPVTGPLDPDRVAATEFATSFRGYDTAEVQAFLASVADALRAADEREQALREQLGRAEQALRDLRESAAAEVEAAAEEARREGREMVAEAQRVRERMLGDLARRRRHARQQVEQLMAGRERLLEAFDAARHTIEAATADLRGALPEARLAAEAAGRRFDQEGEPPEAEAVAALEGEIEAARLAGLPIVAPSDHEDAVRTEAGTRAEPSLLGERDVREMAPVELGADFEDVRIVPVEVPVPAEEEVGEAEAPGERDADADADGDADADAADAESDTEIDATDVEPVVEGEVEAELAAAEVAAPGDDVSADHPGPDEAVATSEEPATRDEGGDDDEEAADRTPVDPGHLDDLFASLRAAREEAVTEARAVLSGGDEAPAARTDHPVADTEAEAEPRDEPAPAPAPEPGSAPADEPPPVVEALPTEPVDVEQALVEAADELARGFKRVLGEQQNALIERLRALRKGQAPDPDAVLDGAGALTERFAGVAAEPLGRLAAGAMASMAPDHRARPPAAAPMATAVGTELAAPLHDRLVRALEDAGDGAEAAGGVRSAFREWKGQRVGALAADAARSAYHAGLLAGVAKGSLLEWVLDDVDGACPECADNALAGPVVRGDRYPTGHRHPPAHDGCRCLLRPAAREDADG